MVLPTLAAMLPNFRLRIAPTHEPKHMHDIGSGS